MVNVFYYVMMVKMVLFDGMEIVVGFGLGLILVLVVGWWLVWEVVRILLV